MGVFNWQIWLPLHFLSSVKSCVVQVDNTVPDFVARTIQHQLSDVVAFLKYINFPPKHVCILQPASVIAVRHC